MSERDLAEELKQLELAYHMATEMSQFKAGFLARISHELRSPLNGLIGMHQLILSNLCDNPEEEREFIAQANTSALQLMHMLDDILNVARVEYGSVRMTIQPVQVAKLLQQVYDLTHLPAKDRNLNFEFLAPHLDLYILAEPTRLQQVLVSLVNASIAQMPEGTITLSAKSRPETHAVHIWIDDRCPVEARSEPIDLLHPLATHSGDHHPASPGQSQMPQTTHFAMPSPGLNLLISQTIVELMQGRLEVVANQSNGVMMTQIQCSLPLVQEDV